MLATKFRYSNILLFLIAISLIVSFIIYPSLPEKIPSHWNIRGEIDGYSHKIFFLFTSFLPLGIYLLMNYLPRIESRKKSYLMQNRAYSSITIALVLFFLLLHWLIIFSALGYSVSTSRFLAFGIGILFLIIGYFMDQIKPNHIFGIKTPWTITNERVWKKTHEVGGFAFILTGLMFIFAGLLNKPYIFTAAIVTIFIVIFFLFLYSYLEYQKLKKISNKQDS